MLLQSTYSNFQHFKCNCCFLCRYQKSFEYVSSQLVSAVYFMSDVHNWRYLVIAPKRKDYGSGTRKGKKEEKLWDLFKDAGTEELQNSAAKIISKLLLGDELNNDGTYICMCVIQKLLHNNFVWMQIFKGYNFADSNFHYMIILLWMLSSFLELFLSTKLLQKCCFPRNLWILYSLTTVYAWYEVLVSWRGGHCDAYML